MSRKKFTLVAILISINLIFLLMPIDFAITLDKYPHVFQPNSSNPRISIDKDDNAIVQFVSYIDYGKSTYNVAYVKIGNDGRMMDGPKFISNNSINIFYRDSITRITDNTTGVTYYFTIKYSEDNEMGYLYGQDVFIYYTKVDGNGTIIVENKTIAHHSKTESKNDPYGPVIFGLEPALDSKNNLHMAWYVLTGPGTYYEVYYTKINDSGDILVPQMKLYVFDYNKLLTFALIYMGIPIASITSSLFIYSFFSKKIVPFTNFERSITVPLSYNIKIGAALFLIAVILLCASLLSLLLTPNFIVITYHSENLSKGAPFGGLLSLLSPMFFLLGFASLFIDKQSKKYHWHYKISKYGTVCSIGASILSFMFLYTAFSDFENSSICWLMLIYIILLIILTILSIERTSIVFKSPRFQNFRS